MAYSALCSLHISQPKFLGKLNRGISVVDTVEILRGKKLEGAEYKKAAVLGWSVELVSTHRSTTDYALFTSKTRRSLSLSYKHTSLSLTT